MDQLQLLYESEINFQISSFHDEGFTWKLGDERNGYRAMGTARTMKVAVMELVQAAMQAYPQSDFAMLVIYTALESDKIRRCFRQEGGAYVSCSPSQSFSTQRENFPPKPNRSNASIRAQS